MKDGNSLKWKLLGYIHFQTSTGNLSKYIVITALVNFRLFFKLQFSSKSQSFPKC